MKNLKFLAITCFITFFVAVGCEEQVDEISNSTNEDVIELVSKSTAEEVKDDNKCYEEAKITERNTLCYFTRPFIEGNAVIDGTHIFTFYDQDGNEQESYDDLETEKIHRVSSFEGSISTDKIERSVTKESEIDLTGLYGENSTIIKNGTGSFNIQSTFSNNNRIRNYVLDGDIAFNNIIFEIGNPYPLSGTKIIHINGEITVSNQYENIESTFEKTIIITFNGTSTPVVTIDGDKNFTINLATGNVNEI